MHTDSSIEIRFLSHDLSYPVLPSWTLRYTGLARVIITLIINHPARSCFNITLTTQSFILFSHFTYVYIYIYICLYICVYVYVCMCRSVCGSRSRFLTSCSFIFLEIQVNYTCNRRPMARLFPVMFIEWSTPRPELSSEAVLSLSRRWLSLKLENLILDRRYYWNNWTEFTLIVFDVSRRYRSTSRGEHLHRFRWYIMQYEGHCFE